MTAVNQGNKGTEAEAAEPVRDRRAGWGRLGDREIGGVPLVGVALALLFLLVVALALAAVPPSSPATEPRGHASSPVLATATRGAPVAPLADAFVAGVTDGTITVSWRAPRPLPVGYRVYRATGRYAPYTLVGTVNAPDITSFTDDQDLSPDTTYAYTVTVFDGQTESAPAGPVVAALLPAPRTTPTFTATAQPIGPLPTTAPIPPRTLTAVAALPQPTNTRIAAPGASPSSGLPPVNTPVGPTLATSVSVVASPGATIAGPTVVPVETPAPIPTPAAVPTFALAPTRRP